MTRAERIEELQGIISWMAEDLRDLQEELRILLLEEND